jgi:hypothetical protein
MKSLVVLGLLVGCSGDPVDVEGTYTVGVTNRDNGCNFGNWTVGDMSSGITVQITDTSGAVSADVGGATGLVLDLAFGSHKFNGSLDGNELDLTLQGSRSQNSGNCTWTYNGEILATTNGDLLTGRINYKPATNSNSDCAAIEGCLTYQEFNGSRPPK